MPDASSPETFDAVVIQPVIKTKGVFSESGHAELWISDDDRHMIVHCHDDR